MTGCDCGIWSSWVVCKGRRDGYEFVRILLIVENEIEYTRSDRNSEHSRPAVFIDVQGIDKKVGTGKNFFPTKYSISCNCSIRHHKRASLA